MQRLLLLSCGLLTAATSLSGCTQHYHFVELRAGDVARARQAVGVSPKICTAEGDSLGHHFDAQPVADDERGAPGDPNHSVYFMGPSSPPGVDRTPSPLLATGGVLTGVGGLMLMGAGTTLLACPGPAGCDIPDWAGPLALGGLGAVLVGTVVLVIGGLNPDTGTSPRPYTITNVGKGHVCDR